MERVHRVIAALMLIVFIPVAVLAGPMRLCVSEDGHHAIEMAHESHAQEAVVDIPATLATVADSHNEALPCFDRPLITVQSSHSAAKIDCKLSKPDDNSGGTLLAVSSDLHAASAPRALTPLGYPAQLARDPQLEALRTVILLI